MADEVYRPDHYAGAIEAIEVIETVVEGLPAREAVMLSNVLKYSIRAGRKGDAAKDLAKANNYAYRLIMGSWRVRVAGWRGRVGSFARRLVKRGRGEAR